MRVSRSLEALARLSRARGGLQTHSHTRLSLEALDEARALSATALPRLSLPTYSSKRRRSLPRGVIEQRPPRRRRRLRALSLAISLLLAHVVPASVRTGGERKGGTHCVPSPSTTLSLGFFAARDLCLMSMWLWDGYGTTLGYTSKKEERSAQ